MNTTETQDLLQAAQADLGAARRRLGEAIAGGDRSLASRTRTDIAGIEQRISDLEAALPVARERDEARQATANAQAERERQRAQNELRKAHLSACRNFDEALSLLGIAYDELKATDRNVGGQGQETSRCIRQRGLLLLSAIHAASPDLARDLQLKRPRKSTDIRPFTEHEALLITEFAQ